MQEQKTTLKTSTPQLTGLPFSGHSTGTTSGNYYPGQTLPTEQVFNAGMPSNQHQSAQLNVTDTSEQSNFPRPPIGQRSKIALLQGQQNVSSTSSLPGQNFSNPIISGQPNLSGPPLSNQQTHKDMLMQGAHGQNLIGPSLSKQNLSNPLLQTQQNLSGPSLSTPSLPGQHYSSLQGHQKPGHSFPESQNMPISNLSGPPLTNQQNIHPSSMSGQQNVAQSSLMNQQGFRPSMLGPQNLSGSQMPPLPGQTAGQMINSGATLSQSGQRSYTSGPPIQGQHIGNPAGISRSPTSAMPNYQHTGYQGYNNVYLKNNIIIKFIIINHITNIFFLLHTGYI